MAIATDCNKDIQDDIYVDGDCFGVDAEQSSRSPVDQQSSDSSSESMFYVGPPSLSNINSRYQGVGATSQGGAAVGQRLSQPLHANLPTACMAAAATVGHEEPCDSTGPQVAQIRPGKHLVDLSKTSRPELRPPNESHTAKVTSGTAPPTSQRLAPLGREETEKVAIVQAAPKASSSRKKSGTSMCTLLL